MTLNPLGLIAGLSAFLSIWLGHVAVRRIEARSAALWKPVLAAVLASLAVGIASLLVSDRRLSLVCGILSVTLLWDAFELRRQARRVQRGHAPADPRNPRHAALLAQPGSQATLLDLLEREPLGRPVDPQEAAALVAGRQSQEPA